MKIVFNIAGLESCINAAQLALAFERAEVQNFEILDGSKTLNSDEVGRLIKFKLVDPTIGNWNIRKYPDAQKFAINTGKQKAQWKSERSTFKKGMA